MGARVHWSAGKHVAQVAAAPAEGGGRAGGRLGADGPPDLAHILHGGELLLLQRDALGADGLLQLCLHLHGVSSTALRCR